MNNKCAQALSPQQIDKYKKFRAFAVVGFIVFPVIYLFLHPFAAMHPIGFSFLNVAIGMYFILNWFYLDVEINHYDGKRHTLAACIILLAAVAIPYYLAKSRPKEKRITSILIALGVFLMQITVSTTCMTLHL
ncbi:MAG: hypothetical protein K0U29_08645 [Gammaproteobacteria bacterium]|nr:hypothetical protein [Gammaproteobacteria bacterium]MCH9744980.1 hypothetical protein [Gammaproteobacteria bacterium]